jgi:Na+-translocating ferredoxin:NAD+ oxidoreductase subunit G
MLALRSQLSRRAPALLVVVAALAAALPVAAAQYWTPAKVLKDFFPQAEKITHRKISLTDAEADAIAKKIGASSIKKDWSIYFPVGQQGFAMLDHEKGMHEPIDYAVHFSPAGAVERIEIVEYREAYGDEVRRDRFRNQFRGKTAADPITAGKDIDIVSGASISSRSIAVGVKRDVLVLQAAIKRGALP